MKKGNFLIILASSLLIILVAVMKLEKQTSKLPTDQNQCGCFDKESSGEVDYSSTTALFEGKEISIPKYVFENEKSDVLGLAQDERWVEVDLSDQKLFAWEGDRLFLESLVSTGLPWWPTPTGEFRIWIKLRATKMEGGHGRYYYNLPNVPYVMYFGNNQIPNWRGYGLHGTYWHSDFGTQRSHGCVNLPTEIAKQLYFWVMPALPEGKSIAWADSNNPGTRIIIHE